MKILLKEKGHYVIAVFTFLGLLPKAQRKIGLHNKEGHIMRFTDRERKLNSEGKLEQTLCLLFQQKNFQ
jgi:hypothetical protein